VIVKDLNKHYVVSNANLISTPAALAVGYSSDIYSNQLHTLGAIKNQIIIYFEDLLLISRFASEGGSYSRVVHSIIYKVMKLCESYIMVNTMCSVSDLCRFDLS